MRICPSGVIKTLWMLNRSKTRGCGIYLKNMAIDSID